MVTADPRPQLSWFRRGSHYRLPLPDLFSFSRCLDFLNRDSRECLHHVGAGTLMKLVKVKGELALLSIHADREFLYVEVVNSSLSAPRWVEVLYFVEQLLDLNRDLRPFYQLLGDDPVLGPLLEKYVGLRLIRIPDLFEALCWCVIGQQINLAFAYRLKHRLVQGLGERLEWRGKPYFMFPTPDAIVTLDPEVFSAWQFSAPKARYLTGIATLFKEEEIGKELLVQLPSDQAVMKLQQIQGIGPWSSQYVMMKCLGDAGAFPKEDVGLQNAIKAILNQSDKPTEQQMIALRRDWHPWEAYATFYLWHSLIDTNVNTATIQKNVFPAVQ